VDVALLFQRLPSRNSSTMVQVLSNRKQKVEVKSPKNNHNFSSNWGTIKHGVP
jgi:hypothetical protein